MKDYSVLVKEDFYVRSFIIKYFSHIFISLIEIKRNSGNLIVNIHLAKPAITMANKDGKLLNLHNALLYFLVKRFISRNLIINVSEIVSPDLDARLLADFVRQQLEKRIPFRVAMKNAMTKAKKSGAKGIKVQVSGRLNGTEIARTEWFREGRVPLHTLRADIDYYNHKALENINWF